MTWSQMWNFKMHVSWIYYLCNQCLSPLMLWVRVSFSARCTTLCDKVCQWLATGKWFSPDPLKQNKQTIKINIPSQAFEAKALSIDFRALKSLTWKNKLFFLSLPIAFNSFKSILLPIPMENNVIPLFLASFAAAIVWDLDDDWPSVITIPTFGTPARCPTEKITMYFTLVCNYALIYDMFIYMRLYWLLVDCL